MKQLMPEPRWKCRFVNLEKKTGRYRARAAAAVSAAGFSLYPRLPSFIPEEEKEGGGGE